MSAQIPPVLGDYSVEHFLNHYWQQSPLLIRQAFPGFQSIISADELAGLACEDDVESRIVIGDAESNHWQLLHGPFEETQFSNLPDRCWTLLVQGCNQYHPDLALLLDKFSFIPHWRLDDLMISYACDGGSVGPHTDQYDVFLLQASGRRRWKIANAYCDELLNHADLKILSNFTEEHDWLLNPGDMLYLPPGVAHFGIAQGECMTYSVGFRAPDLRDLLIEYAEHHKLLDPQHALLISDAKRPMQANPGEITQLDLKNITNSMRDLLNDEKTLHTWFGQYITEAKRDDSIDNDEKPDSVTYKKFLAYIQHGGDLQRNEHYRYAYIEHADKQVTLFIDATAYTLLPECAFVSRLLCSSRVILAQHITPHLDNRDALEFIYTLINANYLQMNIYE